MTYYDRVKELVKIRTNTTLEDFIISLGINYGTYHTQRKSGNLPRSDESVKIAQSLGVSVEYLVTGADPAKPDASPLIAQAEALLDGLKKL